MKKNVSSYTTLVLLILLLLGAPFALISCESSEETPATNEVPNTITNPAAPIISNLPVPTPANSSELAEEIIKKSRRGQIAFNTPEKMHTNKTKEIELKLTDNLKEKLIIEEEKGQTIEKDEIDIYHVMTAELTGIGFNIKPLQEDNTFLVLSNKVVTWRWAATPIKTGKQKLYLKINAKLKVDDFETSYTLQSFERVIDVQVNPGNWFQSNWSTLFEIFLTVFGAGVVAFIASKLAIIKKSSRSLNSYIKKLFKSLKS